MTAVAQMDGVFDCVFDWCVKAVEQTDGVFDAGFAWFL